MRRRPVPRQILREKEDGKASESAEELENKEDEMNLALTCGSPNFLGLMRCRRVRASPRRTQTPPTAM